MKHKEQKSSLTTIGIDHTTNRLIDKLCKRFNLKKGEAVRLAFGYLEKASINPSDPPESVKSELAKLNKRQDDLIRFIRHFEEAELNPMVKATHAISLRFDATVKKLEAKIDSEIATSKENVRIINNKIGAELAELKSLLQDISKRINSQSHFQKDTMNQLFNLISLYAELAACGLTEGKKKERLKEDILNIIKPQS
jgi:hypothetical protein